MSTMNGTPLPLGVGDLIGATFKTFSLRVPGFLVLMLLPAVIYALLFVFILGTAIFSAETMVDASPEDLATTMGAFGALTVVGLVSVVVYFVFSAAIAHLAADLSVGAAQGISTYLGVAFRNVLPIVILNIVVGVLASIGMSFFLVPGLWILAVFSMVSVSIVAEGVGFSALGRSIELTREYRWPIVGGFVVMAIIVGIVSAIAGLVLSLIPVVGPIAAFPVQMALYGLLPIWFGLVYARLRLIKEGVGIDRVDEVFT